MDIQIIIPCHNESKIIESTYKKLTEILKRDAIKNNYHYNLLFVDDGSTDNTLHQLINFSKIDSNITYLSFSRNFGKEAAMYAGIENSVEYDAAIIIDADLQHPPELIPKMVENFKLGYDQVIAQRNRKGEKLIRKIPTNLYYKLLNNLVDITIVDGIGDYRLLSNRVLKTISKMEENQRFSKGIFSWVGYKQTILEYDNLPRQDGESKWTFPKLLDYGIDGIISFNNKPLRLIIYLGLLAFSISIIYLLINFIQILVMGVREPGYFTLIFSILFLGSIQLVSIGIIGEYIGRIYYETKGRPHYIEQLNNIHKENKDV